MKKKILEILEENMGEVVTGGQLAKQLDVSRNSIWKSINSLKDEGYSIESIKNSGYRYDGKDDFLSLIQIKKHLKTEFLGRKIKVLNSTDSTNNVIKKMEFSLTPEGYSVLAEEQTSGRGRLGREFISQNREGIYLSFLLKPYIPIENVQFLTICTALAVARAIEKVTGISVDIKWVNDIYYKGKKLCGILTEGILGGEFHQVDGVVVGIGINTGEIPEEVVEIATSLQEITGEKVFRNLLIAEILNFMEEIYKDYIHHNKKEEILAEYKGKQFIIGRKIAVNTFKTVFTATVLDIDSSGRLVVENEKGETLHLNSAEVSLKI